MILAGRKLSAAAEVSIPYPTTTVQWAAGIIQNPDCRVVGCCRSTSMLPLKSMVPEGIKGRSNTLKQVKTTWTYRETESKLHGQRQRQTPKAP